MRRKEEVLTSSPNTDSNDHVGAIILLASRDDPILTLATFIETISSAKRSAIVK